MLFVSSEAAVVCDSGSFPTPLQVEGAPITVGFGTAATILNFELFLSIEPFGICTIQTAEAEGAPVECEPNIEFPWAFGVPSVTMGEATALDDLSFLQCTIGGTVGIPWPNNINVFSAL